MNSDYFTESFSVVVGFSGVGKSSLINALCGEELCKISSKGLIVTKTTQICSFIDKNHRFILIDTPGIFGYDIDESENFIFKELIMNYPKLKLLILVKIYNEVRLSGEMQNAITTLMNSFPQRNFWEHVIIVNTRANKQNEEFKEFMEEEYENFADKINNCENLKNHMLKMGINNPIKLKEFFIDSKLVNKYECIAEEFEKIKEEIKRSELMYKEINVSGILESVKESNKFQGSYILTKYKEIKCIDFNNHETKIENIISISEVTVSELPIFKTEEIEEYYGEDEVKWYDVVSFGIARAARNKSKYKIYKVNYYKVGDILIKGSKIFIRYEYR